MPPPFFMVKREGYSAKAKAEESVSEERVERFVRKQCAPGPSGTLGYAYPTRRTYIGEGLIAL